MIMTMGTYAFTNLAKFKDPENALYVGGLLSLITLLNYFFFELTITRAGITFCSYRTLFSAKYLPVKNISEYNVTRTQVGGGVQADIYDSNKNIFASFATGTQDSDFISAMQALDILRVGEVRRRDYLVR